MRQTYANVVVLGGINTDYLVRGRRLPSIGESVEATEFQRASGGKGANQALAATRLGAKVSLIGQVGNDNRGTEIIEDLTQGKVDCRFVSTNSTDHTGVALIMVAQNGQRQIMTALGANRAMTISAVEAAKNIIQRARVLLLQLEPPMDCLIAAAKIARSAGVSVMIDPGPAMQIPDELLKLTNLLKPNPAETAVMTGVQVTDWYTARHAAEKFMERGVEAVVTHCGDAGKILVSKREELWLPRLPLHCVDATGAGDAFAAGIAAMLGEGKPLIYAAHFANGAAALTTTKMGAQAALPYRDQVEQLLAQPEIVRVTTGKAPNVPPSQASSMPAHVADILPAPSPGAVYVPHMAEKEERTVSADVVTLQQPEGKTTMVVEREAGRPTKATVVARRRGPKRGSEKPDSKRSDTSGRHPQGKH